MAEPHHPDDLAQLRAELAAQRAAIARLTRHRQLPRRALPLLLAALLVALVPIAALAANPFVDLNPNSVHNANIDAIYTAGITTGCDPGVAYCPNGLVTREEMASFLARTAGIGGNPPVANAKTAQTVPDRAITPAKIGSGDAAAGQVLTATGTGGAAFQAPPAGTGPQGPAGPPGPPGANGATSVVIRQEFFTVPAGPSFAEGRAFCQAGETLTGGGFNQNSGPANFLVLDNHPDNFGGPNWYVGVLNSGGAMSFIAYAICATP
jgi:hypothetical protein